MKQLVNTWLEAEVSAYGGTLGSALKELNQACGTATTYSRLSEWRRGVYKPSHAALAYMLFHSLPYLFAKAGLKISATELAAIEDMILPIRLVNGQREIDLSDGPKRAARAMK